MAGYIYVGKRIFFLKDTGVVILKIDEMEGWVNEHEKDFDKALEEAYKFLELGERPCSNDYINTQVLNEIEYYLNNNPVKPTVYIGYTRNAFFAKDDPDFRLTFDSNIISRRNNLSLEFGNSGDDILGEDKYLMEVKILGAIPVWFTRILSELSIYNTHFSKYGNEYMSYCLSKQNNHVRGEKVC